MSAWSRASIELALAGFSASVLTFAALLLAASADGAAAGRPFAAIMLGLGPGWRLAGPLAVALGLAAVAARWRSQGWLMALEISGRSPRGWLVAAAAVALLLSPWTAALEAACGGPDAAWTVLADRVVAPDGRTVDLESLAFGRQDPPVPPRAAVLVPTTTVQVGGAILLVAAAMRGGPSFFAVLAATVAMAALIRADALPGGTFAFVLLSMAVVGWTGRRSRPPG